MLDCDPTPSLTLILPRSIDAAGRHFVAAGRVGKTIQVASGSGDLIYSRGFPNGVSSLTLPGGSVNRLWANGSGSWYLTDPSV